MNPVFPDADHQSVCRFQTFNLYFSICTYVECRQPLKPYEPVKEVECTNPECPNPNTMHSECFQMFECKLIEGLSQQGNIFDFTQT